MYAYGIRNKEGLYWQKHNQWTNILRQKKVRECHGDYIKTVLPSKGYT